MKTFYLLIFFSFSQIVSVFSQSRAIYFKLNGIQTDTAKKQIVFRYQLGNIAPKDSLGISIKRANGQIINLKAVYGDVGTTLTDGRKKTIVWNPVIDRQKMDEKADIIFTIKTVGGQGLSPKQYIDLGRWAVSAGLAGYSLGKGISIINKVNDYNGADLPTSVLEKAATDVEMNQIRQLQQRFYPILAISVAALLANITLSVIQSNYKLKSSSVRLTGTSGSVGLSYKF